MYPVKSRQCGTPSILLLLLLFNRRRHSGPRQETRAAETARLACLYFSQDTILLLLARKCSARSMLRIRVKVFTFLWSMTPFRRFSKSLTGCVTHVIRIRHATTCSDLHTVARSKVVAVLCAQVPGSSSKVPEVLGPEQTPVIIVFLVFRMPAETTCFLTSRFMIWRTYTYLYV